jgi:hypothetical protein
MYISPKYQAKDFQQPPSIDDKITIFADRTLGWKLDIADQLINGRKRNDGSEERSPIPHSGYATMDIVFSYFEMIAKYEDGYTHKDKSKQYFISGVYSVFPSMKQYRVPAKIPGVQGKVVSVIDYVLDLMYEGVRCGLYHSGFTNGRIVITRGILEPMALDLQNMVLIINPHPLVPKLITHFNTYVSRLRDSNNLELRNKFEVRFDIDSQV